MNIKDIAKKLGVSHITVSRALNPARQHQVRPQTRERIKDFARKNQYVKNAAARSLATGLTGSIGVILPTQYDSYFFRDQAPKILEGIRRSLTKDPHQHQCKVVFPTRGNNLSDLQMNDLSVGIDGLLISCQCDHALETSTYLPQDLLKQWNRPVVTLNPGSRQRKKINAVSFSNFEAARTAVRHLITKGHTTIGSIYGEKKFEDCRERFEGYLQALKEHNISFQKDWLAYGNNSIESGYQGTLKIFNQKKVKPTALFCTNDEMAIGAIQALKALRLEVPRDVAVMGFDGIDIGRFTSPPLSTVRQPIEDIAEAGTTLLIELIEQKLKGPVSRTIEAHLTLRDSA